MTTAPGPDYFELTLTHFTPHPVTESCKIETVAELDEYLLRIAGEKLLSIGVGCIADEADWGSCWLFINGDRAHIHLLEGPCVTGRDPSIAEQGGERVRFRDDGGNWHDFEFVDTVSREQGLRALRHWLPRGEKLPELRWDQAPNPG